MAAEGAVMWVTKVTYFGRCSYLNSHCFRKSINLTFYEFLEGCLFAFVAKLGNKCFCWFPATTGGAPHKNTNMVSSYKAL